MTTSIATFVRDLELVDRYAETLTCQAFYIAGLAVATLPLPKVLTELARVQELYEEEALDDTQKTKLEYKLSQGQSVAVDLNLPPDPQPARTAQPAQPARPVQPVQPARPVQPAQPARPVQPAEANQPAKLLAAPALEAKARALLDQLSNRMANEKPNSNCPMCWRPMDARVSLVCGDEFHPGCIRGYIKRYLDERVSVIPCVSCRAEVALMDVKEALSRDDFRDYQELTSSTHLHLTCCPAPDCNARFPLPEEPIECPECRLRCCFKCRTVCTAQHEHLPLASLKKVAGTMFKQCPRCDEWVLKDVGRNQLISKCGFSFCFECGLGECTCRASKRLRAN